MITSSSLKTNYKRMKKFLTTLCLCFIALLSQAQNKSFIDLLKNQPKWVDSVFNRLSKKQRIEQLFFVRAHTDKGKAYEDSIALVIKKQHIGGLVFFQGGPSRQAALTNRYQALSRVPLLVAADGEWGLGMRLDSTLSYPYQMALGAIQNKELIYKMGLQIAKDFKRLGMQMNLAPDADVNNNAKNPVINFRSFGENKYNVAEKAAAYMKGMQDGGLLTTIKHFPGHGDTDVDSHYDLPQLKFTKERLDTLEMYPFKELIKRGASGVMIAHMNIPALDATPNLPSTLSKNIVTGILKQQLGFKGLVISDAMNMQGVVKNFKNGEADVMGLIAGNDILELSENSERAIELIKKALKNGRINWAQVNQSVRKILTAKYWAGLNQIKPVKETQVFADVNRAESINLIQQLANASVTLLRGKDYLKTLVPIRRTAIISIGVPSVTPFQKNVAKDFYNSVYYVLDRNANANTIAKVARDVVAFDQVIVGIHDTRTRPGNDIPLSADLKQFIASLSSQNAVFALFANPYNLTSLKGLENSKTLIIGYQKDDFMQKAAAAVIGNTLVPTGKLPVTVNQFFKYGDGF